MMCSCFAGSPVWPRHPGNHLTNGTVPLAVNWGNVRHIEAHPFQIPLGGGGEPAFPQGVFFLGTCEISVVNS